MSSVFGIRVFTRSRSRTLQTDSARCFVYFMYFNVWMALSHSLSLIFTRMCCIVICPQRAIRAFQCQCKLLWDASFVISRNNNNNTHSRTTYKFDKCLKSARLTAIKSCMHIMSQIKLCYSLFSGSFLSLSLTHSLASIVLSISENIEQMNAKGAFETAATNEHNC